MAKNNSPTSEKKISGDKSPSSSSNSNEIVLRISPFTGVTLLVLFAAILFSWDKYKFQNGDTLSFCEVTKGDYENRTEWITIPDHKNQEEYLQYEQGTFIYRHIYMEDFYEVFGVKPIDFPVIDNDIYPYLAKHNLRARLLNSTDVNQDVVQAILKESDNYIPQIQKIKHEVASGTYVDDGKIYIRWVHDMVGFGMYAGKSFQRRDMLGVYAGLVTRQLSDLEYAWEFNYLVEVLDDEGQKVRVCIDAKHMGNYMRFANHRDTNQNGDQFYVVYNDVWHVLYLAQADIKPHEQIFVNYGQGYWENKKKYEF